MLDLTPDHPAVEAASKAWAESHPTMAATWAKVSDRLQGITRARMAAALAAALPHLTADDATGDARTPEPLPCGCENSFNAIHLLDHGPQNGDPPMSETPDAITIPDDNGRAALSVEPVASDDARALLTIHTPVGNFGAVLTPDEARATAAALAAIANQESHRD